MNRNTDLSPLGRLLFGGIFVLCGLGIVLVGAGVLPVDPKTVHAPLWLIGCMGLSFMAAGAGVALGGATRTPEPDGSLSPDAPMLLRLLQYGLGLLVVSGLAAVGTWVAFGPGERNFKSTISVLGWGHGGAGEEWIGRAMFGIGAVLCWLMLVAVARQGWRRLFPRS